MSSASCRILAGTSGFSYEDWRGSWYPAGLPKRAMLDYYADRFPALEINATYYGTPSVLTARRMVERASGRLCFAVKAPGDLTHKGLAGPDVILPFREFLEPFAGAGCLGPVLLQFPASFVYTRDHRDFLAMAAGQLAGLELAVEFRSATWDGAPARAEVGELGVVRVVVDQPAVKGLSVSLEEPAVPAPFAYYRFHGRNAGGWYGSEERHGRYRYRYGTEELHELAAAVRKGAERATTYAFFNNHPDGNAAQNAERLAGMLGLPPPPESATDLFGEE